MRPLTPVVLMILLAGCEQKRAAPADEPAPSPAPPVRAADPKGASGAPPTSTRTPGRDELIERYAADCKAGLEVLVSDEKGVERLRPECEAYSVDEDQEPDLYGCRAKLRTCQAACVAPCNTCQKKSVEDCESCKLGCKERADSAVCLKGCGDARRIGQEQCLSASDTCRDGDCADAEQACVEAGEARVESECGEACDAYAECARRLQKQGAGSYQACADKFPKLSKFCRSACEPLE